MARVWASARRLPIVVVALAALASPYSDQPRAAGGRPDASSLRLSAVAPVFFSSEPGALVTSRGAGDLRSIARRCDRAAAALAPGTAGGAPRLIGLGRMILTTAASRLLAGGRSGSSRSPPASS